MSETEFPYEKKAKQVLPGDVVLAAFGNAFEVWAVGEITEGGVKTLFFRNQTGSSVLSTTPTSTFDVIGSFDLQEANRVAREDAGVEA